MRIPWQLSGGLRQRAMIAMALSCKPRLLIADEPTTAIDVTTQAQILGLLRELQHKYQTAIIFITHDLGVIAQMANYVVVMYLGRIMEEGPVDDIFHAPQHPYTRALLRSIPSLQTETRAALPVIAGTLPHPFNRPSGCPFHPRCEDILPARCATAVPALHSLGPRRAGAAASCTATWPNRHDCAAARSARAAQILSDRQRIFPPRHRSSACGRRRVSFTVQEGETLGLVGESGCGKTTTARCILRAIDPTGGQILYRTKTDTVVDLAPMSAAELGPLRRDIQMIFQDPFGSLNPRMTLLDNVGEPLLVNGMRSRRQRTDRVAELLRLVGFRPGSCTASRTRSAAVSGNASALRARWQPGLGWWWRTSRCPRSTCRCRRRY